MKQRIVLFLRYALYWILFSIIARIVFAFYQWQLSSTLPVKEWLLSFLHGLQHDCSLAGYIMVPVGLAIIATFFIITTKWIHSALKIYTRILTGLFILVWVPNLELYRNWGFHLDVSVLSYLKTPKEATASTSVWTYLLLMLICVAFYVLYDLIARKLVFRYVKKLKPVSLFYLPVWLILVAALIIPIRGGVGIAPVNAGTVYYTSAPFANHLAVNPVWNFLYSIEKKESNDESYNLISDQVMKAKIAGLYHGSGQFPVVLNTKRPNVIVFLLESFTAKIIEPLGGKPGVTPNFNNLCKEGILFDNFYASGDRSKKGIVAVLSGYPPLPKNAIISFFQKTQRIPSLAKVLNNRGYNSSFYYGGDLHFASMNSYILNAGFHQIITRDNFPRKDYNSKWGVHDGILLNQFYNDINQSKRPFFKALFTLSSHEPFDVPMKTAINGSSEDNRFMNSAYYSDQCLGEFIRKAKQSSWWKNTLIILVADHGTRYVGGSSNADQIRYKIPMLWIGGALKTKGIRITKYGDQPDLAGTLLPQLGLSARSFVFSKNLLDPQQKGFAFYDYENGFGFLTPHSEQSYDFTGKNYITNKCDSGKTDETTWKAMIQYIYKDFLKR